MCLHIQYWANKNYSMSTLTWNVSPVLTLILLPFLWPVCHLPAGGGVCPALRGPWRGRSMSEHRGYSGSGVSLGNGDLLGLAGLFSTVGTETLTFEHWGTGTMETVRDADVWLALHEGSLHDEKNSLRQMHTLRIMKKLVLVKIVAYEGYMTVQ